MKQTNNLPDDQSNCSPASIAEMEALENAIAIGQRELINAQQMVDNIHRKQAARRQELGFQKARIGMKLTRVSDTPSDGARMVIVQTDSGISTRWIRPDNGEILTENL